MKYRLDKKDVIAHPLTAKGLCRIVATKNFGDVKKGDKGGYVEHENNLSQHGDCWIYDKAQVYGNATILQNAKIKGHASISDYARIQGNAKVTGYSLVFGRAVIYENAEVHDSRVHDSAEVLGECIITDSVIVHKCKILEKAIVSNSTIHGFAVIKGKVFKDSDYITFANLTSLGRQLTYNFNDDFWVESQVKGLFEGSTKQLKEYVKTKSCLSALQRSEYNLAIKHVQDIKNLRKTL